MKTHFLFARKINPKTDRAVPGLSYTSVERQKKEKRAILVEQERVRALLADTSYWYGQVGSATPVLDEAIASGENITTVPSRAVVKIRRYNYNYWQVWINGKVGYINTFSVYHFSRSESPFIKTDYLGRTFSPFGESSPRTNTPTTGAQIHTGPRGGRYYYNSNGNKTYIKR